jgi:hypothetical protein
VKDKTRFVFNDVFSRVLFEQLFLPIHDKTIYKYCIPNSKVLELEMFLVRFDDVEAPSIPIK